MTASFFTPSSLHWQASTRPDRLKIPTVLGLTVELLVVASLGNLPATFIGGANRSTLPAKSLAVAIGMNARGWTEVMFVASVGGFRSSAEFEHLLDDRDDEC